MLFLLHH